MSIADFVQKGGRVPRDWFSIELGRYHDEDEDDEYVDASMILNCWCASGLLWNSFLVNEEVKAEIESMVPPDAIQADRVEWFLRCLTGIDDDERVAGLFPDSAQVSELLPPAEIIRPPSSSEEDSTTIREFIDSEIRTRLAGRPYLVHGTHHVAAHKTMCGSVAADLLRTYDFGDGTYFHASSNAVELALQHVRKKRYRHAAVVVVEIDEAFRQDPAYLDLRENRSLWQTRVRSFLREEALEVEEWSKYKIVEGPMCRNLKEVTEVEGVMPLQIRSSRQVAIRSREFYERFCRQMLIFLLSPVTYARSRPADRTGRGRRGRVESARGLGGAEGSGSGAGGEGGARAGSGEPPSAQEQPPKKPRKTPSTRGR